MMRMEVFCEPPIFVKAQPKDTDDKLYLTNIDQQFNYYRSNISLVYRSNGKELGEVADPARAVRRGVEEMVAHHYPWAAGRLRLAAHGGEGHRLEVCFNEDGGPGVQFVSAHADCPLGDLSDPNPGLEPLFASVDINAPLHSRPLVALQVTRFQNGGFCVSMNTARALFDGVAASIFMQNISSCAQGQGLCINLDKAPRELRIKPGMMPLQQEWPLSLHGLFAKDLTTKHLSYVQPLAATRFKFSKEDLAQLRLEALSKQQDCGMRFITCSRLLALAAHLWKAKAKSLCIDPSEVFPLRIVVNIRGRIIPSIPVNYMGNAFCIVTPCATVEELREKSLAFAVEKIQQAIKQITAERFQLELDYVQMLGGSARMLPGYMAITSLAGLGFYEADFGWGKPAYLVHPYKQRRNLFVISDSNAQYNSLNLFTVFDSQVELQKFQDALHL